MSDELKSIEIEAALEQTMTMPIENLLAMEEFVAKLEGIQRAKQKIDLVSEGLDAA